MLHIFNLYLFYIGLLIHFCISYLRSSWTRTLTHPDIPDFSGDEPGPTPAIQPEDTPLSLLFRYFPEHLWQHIAQETNEYAQLRQNKAGRPDSKWKDVTAIDIRTYLGLRVYMSIISLPSYEMYWSKDFMFGGFFCAKGHD